MKKRLFIVSVLALTTMSFVLDSPISEEQGMVVVNTTTLCPDVKGYADAVPVKIYIKGGKIEKIKPLHNAETPKFWALIKKEMLPKWEGMDVKKAAKTKVDAVTGATFSSKALLKNVQTGCDYYLKSEK
ncbi:MAG: FMN-binding protein [Bacteroidaceae bacterium]|nr:FMN-binding protein [Bacteroidaceae bacterium]